QLVLFRRTEAGRLRVSARLRIRVPQHIDLLREHVHKRDHEVELLRSHRFSIQDWNSLGSHKKSRRVSFTVMPAAFAIAAASLSASCDSKNHCIGLARLSTNISST